jgi:hypothetical protein
MELPTFWEAASRSAAQHFMEPKGSLRCLQGPSTGPYPEPNRSSQYQPILSVLILFFHLLLGLHSGVWPSGFPTKTLYTYIFLFSPDIIILGEEYKLCPSLYIFPQLSINPSSVQIYFFQNYDVWNKIHWEDQGVGGWTTLKRILEI